jgi:hypothetical protein
MLAIIIIAILMGKFKLLTETFSRKLWFNYKYTAIVAISFPYFRDEIYLNVITRVAHS